MKERQAEKAMLFVSGSWGSGLFKVSEGSGKVTA